MTIGLYGNWGSYVSLKNPDGSTLMGTIDVGLDGNGTTTLSLPSTGTYSILIDPRGVFTGNMTVTLSSELTSTITIDGLAETLALTRVGQNAKVAFTANAGQQTQLKLTNVTIGNSTWGRSSWKKCG